MNKRKITIRQWLIKNFVGERWNKIPFTDKWTTSYKGAVPLMLTFVSIGILMLLGLPQLIVHILLGLWLAFALYIGFPLGGYGYFQKYPVQWEELNEMQKWYYGSFVLGGFSSKKLKLTPEQFEEWIKLDNKFKLKFNFPKE